MPLSRGTKQCIADALAEALHAAANDHAEVQDTHWKPEFWNLKDFKENGSFEFRDCMLLGAPTDPTGWIPLTPKDKQ